MNIEDISSALSTIDSEEDADSNSDDLDMNQLQRALFNSLQALGSSTTTTTTTTTTSPSGEVSQLVYVAVATNGAPQIRLALPVSDEVSVDNLLSSDTLVTSLDNLDSMLHGFRIARSNGNGSSDGYTPQDPLLASITAGRHALVKFNEDSKYYSALIAGHMEDGTYQILYKGVDPWISAIFNWDGPTYPNQSVNGVSTRDIFPVTSTTKDKRLYSDANCWVNMDQDQDGIPDRQMKKDDIVYARWQGDRGNMYYDGKIAYIEDDGMTFAVKYNDGDFENFVSPKHIFLRIGL